MARRSPRRVIGELADNAEMAGMLTPQRFRRRDGVPEFYLPGRFVESQPEIIREALCELTSDDVADLMPMAVRYR